MLFINDDLDLNAYMSVYANHGATKGMFTFGTVECGYLLTVS